MSSNTLKRVLSGLALLAVTIICIALGKVTILTYVLIVGIIILDELLCNFFLRKRFSLYYFLTQFILIIPYAFFGLYYSRRLEDYLITVAIVQNVILGIFLFFINDKHQFRKVISSDMPFVAGLYLFFSITPFYILVNYDKWPKLILLLVSIVISMDTGAWFIGRNFGKRKLAPNVSPNKTIEGFLGGVIICSILGSLIFYLLFDGLGPIIFFVIALLGIVSQIGDLVQSKIKRKFSIKDSSNLIPGHGGMYDRADSLIFMIPFYILTMRYLV